LLIEVGDEQLEKSINAPTVTHLPTILIAAEVVINFKTRFCKEQE